MDKIATNKKTREIIELNKFSTKKNFGQNFLIDQHVVGKIIDAADLSKDDLVIEIGPGIGSLTEELLERAGKVIAIEIDRTLIPILNKNLSMYDNLEIINQDVLKLDLKEIIENSGYEKAKIVANLPYYITTPIVMGLLEKQYPISDIVVMIQKEVAHRMNAKKSTKEYGSLTITVNFFANTELVANVPPNSFIPRPNVDSAVIKITPKDADVEVDDVRFFFQVVKASFSMRRKTLVNCLFGFDKLNLSKKELEDILEELGFDKKIRGESLDINDYAKLTNKLLQYKI